MSTCLTEALLLSTYNICFCGEMRKIINHFGWKKKAYLKLSDIFLVSSKKKTCTCIIKTPQWGDSNEYPHLFLRRNKENTWIFVLLELCQDFLSTKTLCVYLCMCVLFEQTWTLDLLNLNIIKRHFEVILAEVNWFKMSCCGHLLSIISTTPLQIW